MLYVNFVGGGYQCGATCFILILRLAIDLIVAFSFSNQTSAKSDLHSCQTKSIDTGTRIRLGRIQIHNNATHAIYTRGEGGRQNIGAFENCILFHRHRNQTSAKSDLHSCQTKSIDTGTTTRLGRIHRSVFVSLCGGRYPASVPMSNCELEKEPKKQSARTTRQNAFCGVRLKAINARGAQPRGIYDSCMIPTNRTNCVQTVIQTVGKTVQTVQTVAIKGCFE